MSVLNRNKEVGTVSGWLMLVIGLGLIGMALYVFIQAAQQDEPGFIFGALGIMFVGIITLSGLFIVNPNYAAVLVLFGKYSGTVSKNGFHWANPFMKKQKISLRARNQETSRLKVNEKSGNPIEIAAVVVWEVNDPYESSFDVDDYEQYVSIQSESALRNLANHYNYDGEDADITLRGSQDEVNDKLQEELQERLKRAGVRVIEARLSHLAYAPEIAGEMLRRQQATAVVAARSTIVDGAVGMVEHALEELAKKSIIELDAEQKATMVSNLLVVLCSENAATPVVNTGTLYQ